MTLASTCFATAPAGPCTSASRCRSETAPVRTSRRPRRPPIGHAHASIVDYKPTRSELGALVLENRLIKQLRPPGNIRLARADDRLVYICCRLDIPFPILEVSPRPAAGHAVTIGPLRGRRLAIELVEQLDSLFALRHCGRRLVRREYPSAYGQMGRCLSPCLGDLDPNLYRRRLDAALRMFIDGGDGGQRLIAHVEGEMRQAAAQRRYERAHWLRRRARRLGVILGRLGGRARGDPRTPPARRLRRIRPAPEATRSGWRAGRLVDWGTVAGRARPSCRSAPRRQFGAAPARASSGHTSRRMRSTRCGSSRHTWPRIQTRRSWPSIRPQAPRPLTRFLATASSAERQARRRHPRRCWSSDADFDPRSGLAAD